MKTPRTILLLTFCGMLLYGCTSRGSLTGDTSEKTTFTMSVDTWIGYAPLYLAKEKGFNDGVDVEILMTPDVAQRKLMLERGDIAGMAETVDQLVLDHSQGIHTVAVTSMDVSNGGDGIVAVDSIKTIQDLKGKTVFLQKNYISEALLDYLLEKNGMNFTDVNTVDIEGSAAGAAFAAGKTDAAVTFEPWLSKAKERTGGHVLLSSKDAPGVIVDILSVHEQYLHDHPDVVAKVVRGWFRAVEYWRQHPAEANAIMAKYYSITPKEFADDISGLLWPSYDENVKYFTKGTSPSIYTVADIFVRIFQKTGQIRSVPDLTTAVDASVLQSIHGQE